MNTFQKIKNKLFGKKEATKNNFVKPVAPTTSIKKNVPGATTRKNTYTPQSKRSVCDDSSHVDMMALSNVSSVVSDDNTASSFTGGGGHYGGGGGDCGGGGSD